MKTMKRKMSSARRRPGGGRSKPYGDRTKKEEERTTSDVPQKETSCSKAEAAAGCKSSSTRFPMRKGCTRPVEQEVLQRGARNRNRFTAPYLVERVLPQRVSCPWCSPRL